MGCQWRTLFKAQVTGEQRRRLERVGKGVLVIVVDSVSRRVVERRKKRF